MKSLFHLCLLSTFCGLLYSCKSKTKEGYHPPSDPLFTQISASETGINFVNEIEDSSDYNILTYRNFYNGGGVAIGDINNDKLPDVFLTANLGESKLYLNKGNFKFEDITSSTGIKTKKGWRTGVTMADVNADGWLDIYVCNSGDIQGDDRENELYINQHNNTFKEQAKEFGLNDKGYTTHISFFDYDLDGDLDAYILNNSFVDVAKFDLDSARNIIDTLGGHKLMRNDNGHFVNVSQQSGIASIKIAYGLGVSVSDLNGDMYPDIYISNDFYEKDYLYINQKNGTFKDELPQRMAHISSSSMGADIADINNDGYMDIVTTDMLPEDETRLKTMNRFEEYHVESMKYRSNFHYQYPQNSLQLNGGDANFSEIGWYSGISATDWSWGALIFDFENDGNKDIFISNGIARDITDMDFSDFLANKSEVKKIVEEKGRFDFRDFLQFIPSNKLSNYAYINQKGLHFKNEAYSLGLGQPSFSNGVAYGDLDNDGDMDLVVNNLNDPCFVYRNETNKKKANHFLKISFDGIKSNQLGIGTKVSLYQKDKKQVLQNFPVRSFQSCMENKLIFGLGDNATIDSLEIIWPDLSMQTLYNTIADKELVVHQSQADKKFSQLSRPVHPLFSDKSDLYLKTRPAHKENIYVDFDTERLIPYMLSREGPCLAVGDVNGDGRQDLFMGSAVNDLSRLLIQTSDGFMASPQQVFEKDKEKEDAGAAFFDVDNDKDLDLLVASGGYQYDDGSSLLSSRLYINNGKGNFAIGQMPDIAVNASCVKAFDYDKDGLTDVFIGGRAVAGKYGVPAKSFLLHNENGKLVDRTPEILKEPGMITDAIWSDINNDSYYDLVLVGDWMPVTFFINSNGFLNKKEIVENSSGWWNCITETEVDKNGNRNFLLGNWGLNSRLKATPAKPMELFVNDFDNNGTSECILTYYWPDGKSHLFNSKVDLTSQLPFLKKKFLLYKDYAGKLITDVFDMQVLNKSKKLQVQTLASSLLKRSGNQWILEALPEMAQIAPVFSIVADDFNKDGNVDILTVGNFFDVKPDLGRLDANAASLFLGNVKGAFEYVPKMKSGLNIQGQIRDAASVLYNDKKIIFLARNNESLISLGQN
jgi:hypothetical protein